DEDADHEAERGRDRGREREAVRRRRALAAFPQSDETGAAEHDDQGEERERPEDAELGAELEEVEVGVPRLLGPGDLVAREELREGLEAVPRERVVPDHRERRPPVLETDARRV